MNINHQKVVTIPDPGLYVETKCILPLEPEQGRTNIVVALNGEDSNERFDAKKSAVLWNLGHALVMFWEQDKDVNFIFSPHTWEDYAIMMQLMTFLPPQMLHKNTISTGLHYAYQAPLFYDLYTHVDLILAMRIHAMVPAIGLGTPMIALSSQKRMTEFMKDAGLDWHCLDIFDSGLAGKLCGTMEAVIDCSQQIKSNYASVCNRMRFRTKAFNQKIYNFIKEG